MFLRARSDVCASHLHVVSVLCSSVRSGVSRVCMVHTFMYICVFTHMSLFVCVDYCACVCISVCLLAGICMFKSLSVIFATLVH